MDNWGEGFIDSVLEKSGGDMITKPLHYQIFPEHDIEARHIIERVLLLAKLKPDDSFNLGCALKYLLRAGKKGEGRGMMKEDVGKCRDYCKRLLG